MPPSLAGSEEAERHTAQWCQVVHGVSAEQAAGMRASSAQLRVPGPVRQSVQGAALGSGLLRRVSQSTKVYGGQLWPGGLPTHDTVRHFFEGRLAGVLHGRVS